MKPIQCLFAGLLLALVGVTDAATPGPFTARFQVIKDGSHIGEARMQMRRDGDTWVFSTHTRGTSGLARMLGLNIDETSRFRLHDGRAEMLDYDFRMDASVKKRKRSMHADWSSHRVEVVNDSKRYSYATTPGLVERHLLALSLAHVADIGKQTVRVPVAVKKDIEFQSFHFAGSDTLSLPIGKLAAKRITRSDSGKDFTAWYVPERYAVPVKLQHGSFTLLLESYSSP